MKHVSKKKPPVLASVVVSGPAEGYIGDPPQQCSAAGVDQYGNPFPITVSGWRSSVSTIASITSSGLLTDLTEGTVDIEAQVAGIWRA